MKCLCIRDVTRSHEIRCENMTISLQNILQCLHKSCTINRKKIAILLQTPTQSFSWITTIQLCLLRLFHIVSVSGSWEACFVAAHVDESEGRPSSSFRCERCHSLIWAATDAYDVKQVLKTFCFHAAAGPERATQSFQPDIIISVLQTFKLQK